MRPLTLTDVEKAIRTSFGADTYPPDSRNPWCADTPSRGQCGVAALVVNDLLGGQLMKGEVYRDGVWADYHWWNRLPGGFEIDLTRDQFTPQETVTDGTPVERPPNAVGERLRAQYETLRARVISKLNAMAD